MLSELESQGDEIVNVAAKAIDDATLLSAHAIATTIRAAVDYTTALIQ